MELLFLLLIFLVIVAILWAGKPLWMAITGGIVSTILLFRIHPFAIFTRMLLVFMTPSSRAVLLSLYFITYLQRMLESRKQIQLASRDLDGIFHNRRINVCGAALFIGLLPSAAAMILAADIVKEATDGYLKPKEQAFVTSWIRHIPESTLPTYSGVLLMSTLSGVALPGFMAGMVVPIFTLLMLGMVPYLFRVPRDPGTGKSESKWKDFLHLLQHLWTLILILVLILAFGFSVVPAVVLVIILAAFVYRFKPAELIPMVKSAFEVKLLLNTYLVLVLKELLDYTGVLALLPDRLSMLPIPPYLIFAALFFFGGIISGSAGIIALGTPLAFAAIPGGGTPLMIFLMCICHAASQISPTHVCLAVASEYYHISFGALVRQTIPRSLMFCGLMIIYYNILTLLF